MLSGALAAVFRAASGTAWRENPGRLLLTVLGIALGVTLAVAVHLINASALHELGLAGNRLAGEADLVVLGPRSGFDEVLYPHISRLSAVQTASPSIKVEAQLAGRKDALTIVGLDPFRAARIQRALFAELRSGILDLFDPDAIMLSQPAAAWLGVKSGDTIRVLVGTSGVTLKIIGVLPPGAYQARLGIMDIASAQWRMQRLGRLNRIDLRLQPGADAEALRREISASLPAGVQITTPDADVERNTSISRGYRLNLQMLALVALFTGAFLVFSTQYLVTLRRRSHFALLRAIGITRRELVKILLLEGLAIGAAGSTLGVAGGYALATYALEYFGADLGAGYFRALSPSLHVVPGTIFAFWILGVLSTLAGAAVPSIETGRRAPALALRAGDEAEGMERTRTTWAGIVLIVLAAVLAQAPALRGLPTLGYAAIALLLVGSLLLMPQLAAIVLERLPVPYFPPIMLAIAQLRATPRQVAVSVAAILTSFSLMVSMLIMVGSFRASLDEWLGRMLPADIYVRAARAGETGFFTPEQQAAIASIPGVAHVRFLRSQNLLLRADRPPLTLLARTVDPKSIGATLPLVGRAITPAPREPPPVWVSEIASDLLGLRVGDRVTLPIRDHATRFTVAGIWRDYARQNGSLVIDRDLYVQITGDRLASDAAVWLAAGVTSHQVERAIRERLLHAEGVDIAEAQEIRMASLSVFDRTFAVTYLLEIVAVLIGLFGVSVSFSAQALARRHEFGVLRHLGMTRRQIAVMLAGEGVMVSGFGAAVGLAFGWLISLVLVFVVNRQSFHWSLDLHIPWPALFVLATVLIVAATITAVWSGRRAMDDDVVKAVREDW